MKQAVDRLRLADYSTRPANTQKQVTQATKDIEQISSEIEKMNKPHE